MYSVKSFLIIFILASICFAKPLKHLSYSANLEFSEQLRDFYEDLMLELYFNVELNEDYHGNDTKIFRNTFSTLSHNFNFAFNQKKINNTYFSPLMAFSFSFKKMRYLFSTGSGTYTDVTIYKNTNVRNTRFFIGIKPEFCYKIDKSDQNRRSPAFAIKPVFMIGESFYWGTLDKINLTQTRFGTDISIEFLRRSRNWFKGIAFTFFSYFDYTINSDRDYGTTYGFVYDRSIEYPKNIFTVGFSIGSSFRRFKDDMIYDVRLPQ